MLKTLVHRIQQILLEKHLVLIAIDGYGGAGKTTLAAQIQQAFNGSHIIILDDFATDTTSGADRKRFVEQVLRPLAHGEAARYQRFNWQERVLADWMEVPAHGLVIIEGVSVIGSDFQNYYDLRMWIDCPLELAQERMKERERRAGSADTLENWFNVWEKEDADYARTEPWGRADIIIPAAA